MKAVEGPSKTLKAMIADVKAAGLDKKVAVTEWNFWRYAAHHDEKNFYEPYDTQHVLFNASMLNEFGRIGPEVELTNFYHLVNIMGVLLSGGPKVEQTAMADLFRLYRPALPGRSLPVKVEGPELGEGVAAVDATVYAGQESTHAIVINRSLDEPANVDLQGLGTVNAAEAIAGAAWDSWMSPAGLDSAGHKAKLPPLTIARLELKR
jgi:alpha-L-arabinofuranosidase